MAVENVLVQHIEKTPGVVGGKARIAGTRITVQNIAIWHERMGMGADEIATEFDLSLADIYAALAYYFDHRQEIDDAIRADAEFIQALKQRTPSLLKR
ncbi:MAG: DUF433 domain-containing protein [Chloroflexi bacterium]|nr:DUF433 domain-containing protein [Chloroflexota bacterium]